MRGFIFPTNARRRFTTLGRNNDVSKLVEAKCGPFRVLGGVVSTSVEGFAPETVGKDVTGLNRT